MRSVALDLAAKKIVFCEVSDGKVLKRHTAPSVEDLEELLGTTTPAARVAIEACREAWRIAALLESWGHEVLLVDTTRVRQLGIGQHGRKTDRIDAETLARAVESGRIPLAHMLSPARQTLRTELGVRRALVEVRSNYVTTIRGLLREAGEKAPACDADVFGQRLKDAILTPPLRALTEPLRAVLETVGVQLATVDARIEALSREEPIIELLKSAPGVGPIVAASFVSVIDEAKRFKSAHQVGAYVGLVPSEDSSGNSRRLGRITKEGNSYVRAMLVQAAWSIMRMREPDALCVWARSVAARRGKKVAVVALARRLSGVLWAMWRDGSFYDAASVGKASAKGVEREADRRQDTATKLLAAGVAKNKTLRSERRASTSRTGSMKL